MFARLQTLHAAARSLALWANARPAGSGMELMTSSAVTMGNSMELCAMTQADERAEVR